MRRRLLLPALALAAVSALALAAVAFASQRAARETAARVAAVRHANTVAWRLAHVSSEIQRAVLDYREHPEPLQRSRIAGFERELEVIRGELSAAELPGRGALLWARLASALEVRARERAALVAAVREHRRADVVLASARWRLATDLSEALVGDFSMFNLRRLERAVHDLDALRARATTALLLVLLASGGVLVLFSVWVDRALVRPVERMTDAVRLIADERVELSVPGTERGDELGVLSRATTRMARDLVRANAELEASVQARDEFLSIASHELKTPLTTLKLHVQAAQRRLGAGGEVPAWIETALRQVTRLEALVAELLDLARIRSGRFALSRERVDLADVVAAAVERLRELLARSGNVVEADVARGLEGDYDPSRVERVLTNLLTNAAHHAPGARVSVRAWAEGGSAVIQVEDDGPGIPTDARARIFEPYERAANPRSPGLGMGLYIAKEIVEAHGGRIEVGEAARGGAAFTVTLPSRPPSATANAALPAP